MDIMFIILLFAINVILCVLNVKVHPQTVLVVI
jgi:hypothetical protein